MVHCRRYLSRRKLLCDEVWSGCPSAIKQERVEIYFSPPLSCFPQVRVTFLFSPSLFPFSKSEFLSFHCDFSIPFNQNAPIVGKNTTNSPGRPQTDLGPTMDSQPAAASLIFSWHNLLQRRDESNRSQLAQSTLILKAWVCWLSSCLLLSSLRGFI